MNAIKARKRRRPSRDKRGASKINDRRFRAVQKAQRERETFFAEGTDEA